MHTAARFAARCVAGLLVVAVMVGPVVAVFYAAGNPFSGDVLERLTDRSIDDATIIKLLSVLFYIAWAWFCLPALRQLAGRSARPAAASPTRAPRPTVAPPSQPPPAGARGALARLARYAISGAAATSLMATTVNPPTGSAAPAPTTITATVDTPAPADPAPADTAAAATTVATHRDTPYAIARRLVPADQIDAVRDEIIELNLGRPLPDGGTWRGGALPVGWDVIVPTTALNADPPAAAAPADSAQPAEATSRRHVVRDGESYWSISEDQLRAELGVEPTRHQVLDRMNALMAVNVERLGYADPAMLHTNDELDPAAPAPPTADAAQPAEATSRRHVVRDGESYWSISEDQLRAELGVEPTRHQVLVRMNALMAVNVERLGYADPAMLHTNDELDSAALAPPPADAAQPTPVVVEPKPTRDAEPPAPPLADTTAAELAPDASTASAGPAAPRPAVETATPPVTTSALVTTAPSTTADDDRTAPAAEAAPTPTDAMSATPSQLDPASLPVSTADDNDQGLRFPIAGTLGIASVAAGILAVVEARRRRRIRLHQPGQRASAPPSAEHISTELAARALAAHSHLGRAAAIASALADCYRNGTLPTSALVQGIVVDDTGSATVHIDEEVPPGAPFNGTPGRWTVNPASLDAGDTMGSVDQLLRTIVSVGRTDDAEVFVDLESLGSVAVHGHRHLVTGIIAGIVEQLVDRDDVEIHSDQPLLDRSTGLLTPAGIIDADLLQRLAVDRQPLWDQLDRGEFESVIDARLADWPYEQLIPACVVTATDDVTDVAAAAGGGGRGLAVIAPSAGAIDWHVSDGTLQLDHLGLVVTSPALLDADSYQQLAELVESEPVHDECSLVVVNNPVPAPAPSAATAAEFHERDWAYMVRVLRPVPDVINADGDSVGFVDARNRNGRRGPELVAYLASRPDRRANVELIKENLWWDEITANMTAPRDKTRRVTSDQTVSSLVYRARAVIGKESAIEHVNGWWCLNPRIVSDVELLADRLHFAQTHRAPWAVLRDGLNLIAGEPFTASKSYSWASATGHLRAVHETVSDLAVLTARQAIADARPQDALWACDQALLANPVNEFVLQEALRVEASLDNLDGVRRRFQALSDQLRSIGDEPDPSTLDAYHALLQRRRSA